MGSFFIKKQWHFSVHIECAVLRRLQISMQSMFCNYLVFLKDFKRIMRPRKEHVIFFELFGR